VLWQAVQKKYKQCKDSQRKLFYKIGANYSQRIKASMLEVSFSKNIN
jgi:hypothetical protein